MSDRTAEQIPPHDKDAEICVLGSCLIESQTAKIAFEDLVESDFYLPRHQFVFRVLRGMYTRDVNCIGDTLARSELKKFTDELARLNWSYKEATDFIGKCIMDTPTAASVDSFIRNVKLESAKRKKLDEAHRTIADIHAGRFSDEIADKKTPLTMAEWIDSDELYEQVERIPTGYPTLDQALNGGLMPGSLYIIAGPPGGCKTTFGLNVARTIAAHSHGVLVLSLEDPARDAIKKLIASESHIPCKLFEKWEFTPEQRQAVGEATARLKLFPFRITDTTTLQGIHALVRTLAPQGLKVVIIDQMSKIRVEARDQFEKAALVSREMQSLSRESGVTIILLCQPNRTGCQRDGGPTMHDLRDSGNIEQDARGVLMLKSLVPIEGCPGRAILTIGIDKHTFGPFGITERFTVFLPECRMEIYSPEIEGHE